GPNESQANRLTRSDAPWLTDDNGRVRLPQATPNIPAADLTYDKRFDPNEDLTLTVVLNRTDQQGFDDFLQTLQDPQSPNYRHYLTPPQQAERFGPSKRA